MLSPEDFGKDWEQHATELNIAMVAQQHACSLFLDYSPEQMRQVVGMQRDKIPDLIASFRGTAEELVEAAKCLANAAARIEWAHNQTGAPHDATLQ